MTPASDIFTAAQDHASGLAELGRDLLELLDEHELEDAVRCEQRVVREPAFEEPARPLQRDRCQIGPKNASWPILSCGNTAIKG